MSDPLLDQAVGVIDGYLFEREWTQRMLARRLGISDKHMSEMLNGHSALSLHWMDRIAVELGFDWTLSGEPTP